MKAVIVCGAREALAEDWYTAVSEAIGDEGAITVIHGACGCDADNFHYPHMKGIDRIAHDFARRHHLPVPMPARWEFFRQRYGHSGNAGPERNQQMLTVLRALGACGYGIGVLAFHDDIANGSKGTRNMVQKAKFAGVPYAVYDRGGRVYDGSD